MCSVCKYLLALNSPPLFSPLFLLQTLVNDVGLYPSWSSYCFLKQSPAGKKSQHRSWYIFQTYDSWNTKRCKVRQTCYKTKRDNTRQKYTLLFHFIPQKVKCTDLSCVFCFIFIDEIHQEEPGHRNMTYDTSCYVMKLNIFCNSFHGYKNRSLTSFRHKTLPQDRKTTTIVESWEWTLQHYVFVFLLVSFYDTRMREERNLFWFYIQKVQNVLPCFLKKSRF